MCTRCTFNPVTRFSFSTVHITTRFPLSVYLLVLIVSPFLSDNPERIYGLYDSVGYNCFIAAAIYVVLGALSCCQTKLNKRKASSSIWLFVSVTPPLTKSGFSGASRPQRGSRESRSGSRRLDEHFGFGFRHLESTAHGLRTTPSPNETN